jgi:quinol-cytochrome oxidoreductase complex cytochrome b subunit
MASGVFSFFGSSLVVVQWLAAAVSLVVGVLTAIHLIRNWVRNK